MLRDALLIEEHIEENRESLFSLLLVRYIIKSYGLHMLRVKILKEVWQSNFILRLFIHPWLHCTHLHACNITSKNLINRIRILAWSLPENWLVTPGLDAQIVESRQTKIKRMVNKIIQQSVAIAVHCPYISTFILIGVCRNAKRTKAMFGILQGCFGISHGYGEC